MVKRILVLDDTEDTVEAVKIILESKSFKVLDYNNPLIALKDLEKGMKVDLALIDMRMPEMSGPQLVEKIRANPKIKDLKIVFFTASSDADHELLKKYGVLDYIFKPFDMNQIVKQINGLLKS